jgi:S-adenosylmethionine-diacylglycerol 3-amino-3-carboxypropyl transferase
VTTAAESVAGRAAFDFVRYGSVWEDADVLCEALAPCAPGGRLLSIASAGDNALALLTLDPAEVVAADLNPAQVACLELRRAAFASLDHPALLAFLGVLPAADRPATYRALAPSLPSGTRAFWDTRPGEVARGVIHAGKFERYFGLFRRYALPLVHSRSTVRGLLEPRDRAARHAFYAAHWDTWRWRALFRVFFSRRVMGRLGRDPAFFDHVDGPVGPRILARTRAALTELPVGSNPYAVYILTGNFAAGALPRYLRPEHFATIRARLDRLRAVVAPIEQAAAGPFDGLNLSDVFEYLEPAAAERLYRACAALARPGARLVYWNMLAPRGRPEALARSVKPLEELARTLHARDRAWFYGRLHVDEVVAPVAPEAA